MIAPAPVEYWLLVYALTSNKQLLQETVVLLNNRLLINGNFGYRDNPMANTNFVGDFEAEWLINRSGDIRLKAYNETNDRYYTKTNLTTQGVGIMYKKDFNKWSDLFFWNKWKIRNKREREKSEKDGQQPTDSIITK